MGPSPDISLLIADERENVDLASWHAEILANVDLFMREYMVSTPFLVGIRTSLRAGKQSFRRSAGSGGTVPRLFTPRAYPLALPS
jgi:hypothetical protein